MFESLREISGFSVCTDSGFGLRAWGMGSGVAESD